jgi:tetratricopeptide (TPR) repeat protein
MVRKLLAWIAPYSLYVKLALPLLLALLLGLAARPAAASRSLTAAGRALVAGRYLEAGQALAQAAPYYPWRTDLLELAGRYVLQGGDPRLAISYLEAPSLQGRLTSLGWLALGEAYQQVGNLAQALEAWAAVPEAPAANWQRARLYRQQGDFQAAITALQAVLLRQPQDAQAAYQLGLLLAALQPDQAGAYLEQAAALDAHLAPVAEELRARLRTAGLFDEPAYTLVEAGRALSTLEQWDLAQEAFRQATLVRPDYAEAWAFLGEARQHQNAPQTGLGDLEYAWRLDSKSLAANLFLALYWQRQHDYEQARAYLSYAAQLYPTNANIQVELGRTTAATGDLPAAQAYYWHAVELAPADLSTRRALVEFCLQYQVQVREVALPVARAGVRRAPGDHRALDLMGQTLFWLDDLLNAERFFQRALTIDPTYAPAHLHLAQVYLAAQRTELARHHLKQVLFLAPASVEAGQANRLLAFYFP